jgi:Protein of unknown function (DUF2510)
MRKLWPVLLTVVGVVIFALGVGMVIGGVTSTINSIGTPWVAGSASTQTLSQGSYVVYERSAVSTIGPSDISIRGPEGSVPVGRTTSSNVTIGDVEYVGVAQFSAPAAGDYTITVENSDAELVLGPSIAQTLGSAMGWTGAAVLGGTLAVAGVVWLVLALILGGRKPATAVPAGPAWNSGPPMQSASSQGSWYPDPEDPSQWRWWDGREWTDQRAPRG